MSKARLLSSSIAFLICLVGTDARANLIIFDPDDYAVGAYVSNANPFVTLSTFRATTDTSFVPTFSPVFIGDCSTPYGCASTTGTHVFRDAFGGTIQWGAFGTSIGGAVSCLRHLGLGTLDGRCGGLDRFNVMLMTFLEPTDFVQISGAFYFEDDTYIYGLDDSFNVVGERLNVTSRPHDCGPFDGIACLTTTSLTATSPTIRYAIAGGWSNGTSLDDLRFNVQDKNVGVPEPGTLGLLALGLMGVGFVRRRATRAA